MKFVQTTIRIRMNVVESIEKQIGPKIVLSLYSSKIEENIM